MNGREVAGRIGDKNLWVFSRSCHLKMRSVETVGNRFATSAKRRIWPPKFLASFRRARILVVYDSTERIDPSRRTDAKRILAIQNDGDIKFRHQKMEGAKSRCPSNQR